MRPAFLQPLIRTLAVLLLIVAVAACDSNEPDDDGAGEEELITRVVMTLTPTSGSAITITATSDAGLNGGALTLSPSTLTLAANQTYAGTIQLYDDENGENITAEVNDERDEHQFFYTVTGIQGTTFSITDSDTRGLPVGLEYSVSTQSAGTGSLRIQLGHYDDGPKDGTTLSDETDVDFNVPLAVQ